ncbi:MAG: isopeptide-forming domain-containing fimbrial protein [Clostridiales bacterium]|nr:isopeptide-forming domain-containing fimbrial protein [Clostridiales bacterium]
MKRIWKRAAALLMTMAMVLAMVLPAQAMTYPSLSVGTGDVVTTSETVTISSIPDDAAGLGFNTYQVLYATYDATNGFAYHLTPWAASALSTYTEAEAIAAIVALGSSTSGTSTTEQAELVNTLAAYIAANSTTGEYSVTWNYTAPDIEATADLPVGAYLVIPSATNMSFLNMLVSVSATAGTGNTWETAAKGAVLKGSKLTIEKTVSDTKDGTYVSTADAKIGSTVYYEIKVYVPKFAANDNEKNFSVQDTATNLKINSTSVVVTPYATGDVAKTALEPYTGSNGTDAGYASSVSTDGTTLTVTFTGYYDNVFYDSSTKTYPYEYVIISYEAELLSSAVITSGNGNTATLTYDYDNHTTNTASSNATVYTYAAKLTKYDDETTPNVLSNATFQVSYNNTALEFVEDSTSSTTTKVYRVADKDDTGASTDITTGTDGTITIIGLDAGKAYTVTETKAPSGYSLNTNYLTFTITAETDTSNNLTGKVASVSSTEYTSGGSEVTGNSKTWNASTTGSDAYVNMTVTDTTLSSLPATGSVGIIVFTIAGVIIMILALVLINSGKSKEKRA